MSIATVIFLLLLLFALGAGGWYYANQDTKEIIQPPPTPPIAPPVTKPVTPPTTALTPPATPVIQPAMPVTTPITTPTTPLIQPTTQPATPTTTVTQPVTTPTTTVTPTNQTSTPTSTPTSTTPPTSSPVPVPAPAPAPAPTPAPLPLKSIPTWLKSGQVDGIYTATVGSDRILSFKVSTVPTTTEVTFTGSGMATKTGNDFVIQVKGTIKDGTVTIQIQNDQGKVESATGKETQDTQVLTNAAGKFTLFVSGTRNTLKIPTEMLMTYQYGCEKTSYTISNIFSIDTSVVGSGTDDGGNKFTFGGDIKNGVADFIKLTKGDFQPISYKGAFKTGSVVGQWFASNVSNEFALTPKSATVPAMDVYGFGGKCLYPKTWSGTITVPWGEVVASTLTNFTVDEQGGIFADCNDQWGNSKFTGNVIGEDNRKVVVYKQYIGDNNLITLTGTLTYQQFSGDWTGAAGAGTFKYTPK